MKKIIGMIHLERIRNIEENKINDIVKHAEQQLIILEQAGFQYACIINESDTPHNIVISEKEQILFLKIAKHLSDIAKISLGICVLYNDRKVTLDIAKEINAEFVRIDTFVDLVKSDAGTIYPEYEKIVEHKDSLGLNKLNLYTDIHPKYKIMLSNKTLQESANEAIKNGSSGVIITGSKSGEITTINNIKQLKEEFNAPIFLGSGVDRENISMYRAYIDGFFIGSSIKEEKENNINYEKAKEMIKHCNNL